eukprot:8332774-Pyramimonas_sp.AAC.1
MLAQGAEGQEGGGGRAGDSGGPPSSHAPVTSGLPSSDSGAKPVLGCTVPPCGALPASAPGGPTGGQAAHDCKFGDGGDA